MKKPPAWAGLKCRSLAARTLRPACSNRLMIWPITPLATASGLMMVSVRSRAMAPGLPALAEDPGDGGAHVRGALHGGDAGGLQGLHLLGGRPLPTRDDGPGMAHAATRGRRLAADEAHHGFPHMRLHEGGGLFLRGAADLADHHDGGGARVVLEEAQDVDEARAVDGVAPDADARGLAEVALGQLVHHLVGERAAARDDAHGPCLVDVPGHDADLRLTRRDEPWAVGADEPAF